MPIHRSVTVVIFAFLFSCGAKSSASSSSASAVGASSSATAASLASASPVGSASAPVGPAPEALCGTWKTKFGGNDNGCVKRMSAMRVGAPKLYACEASCVERSTRDEAQSCMGDCEKLPDELARLDAIGSAMPSLPKKSFEGSLNPRYGTPVDYTIDLVEGFEEYTGGEAPNPGFRTYYYGPKDWLEDFQKPSVIIDDQGSGGIDDEIKEATSKAPGVRIVVASV